MKRSHISRFFLALTLSASFGATSLSAMKRSVFLASMRESQIPDEATLKQDAINMLSILADDGNKQAADKLKSMLTAEANSPLRSLEAEKEEPGEEEEEEEVAVEYNNKLFLAIDAHDHDAVKKIIQRAHVKLNGQDYSDFILDALYFAVYNNTPVIVRIILEEILLAMEALAASQDIYARESQDIYAREMDIYACSEDAPLIMAAKRGYYDTVDILLDKTQEAVKNGFFSANEFAQLITAKDEESIKSFPGNCKLFAREYTPLLWAVRWAQITGNTHMATRILDIGLEVLTTEQEKKDFLLIKDPFTGQTPADFFLANQKTKISTKNKILKLTK